MERYDAAVVGSGPAGLASAFILAREGMKVALIDKCQFPREKLCGGLLSGRTRTVYEDLFSAPWGPGVECTANRVRLMHQGRLLSSVDTPHTVYLATRAAFDAHLFSLALAQGPRVFQGTAVEAVDPGSMTVRFRNGDSLRADFIVGADGVTSRVARSLFPDSFRKEEYALCFQSEIPRGEIPGAGEAPEVHFGNVRWGYAWVFPKKETLSIGLGGILGRNGDIRSLFVNFHRQITGREPLRVKSHYIPSGNFRKRPGRQAILLAGDAAGLVEPVTGEGIAFALQSGKYAAQSILRAARLGEPHRAYQFYRARYDEFVRMFSLAKILRPLMCSEFTEPMFLRELPRAADVTEKYMALIAGRTTYARLLGAIARKMARDVLSMLIPGRKAG